MAFLTPLFLAALAGLAIPVLLHLIQKERKNVVPFPVADVPAADSVSVRSAPPDPPLAPAHDASGGARADCPCVRAAVLPPPGPGRRGRRRGRARSRDPARSVLQHGVWRSVAARACRRPREAVNGLGDSDRGSIVLFGSGAEVVLRSTADRSRLQTALAGVETSASATRYGPALKLAGSILGESALPRREAILISDFQRAGWQGAEGVRLPDGAALTPVADRRHRIRPTCRSRRLRCSDRSFENQERVTITAGVANHSDAASSADRRAEISAAV